MTKDRDWSKTKHADPKDTGPMVKAFLAWPQGYPRDREEYLSVHVNGHPYRLKFGAENTAPRDVWAVVKNSKSSMMKTPGLKHELSPGGVGRPQSEIMAMAGEFTYVNDFEVVGEKEL